VQYQAAEAECEELRNSQADTAGLQEAFTAAQTTIKGACSYNVGHAHAAARLMSAQNIFLKHFGASEPI